MSMAPPPGASAPGGVALPQRGVFATSEILPMISQAAAEMNRRRQEWEELRTAADNAKAEAKRVRANLIVTLRTWGNDVTGQPIKTSAERQEWADADADVQRLELEADLAQTVQMTARQAYDDAQSYFSTLSGLLAIERDEMKREHGGPPGGPF